jgi:hypothetical protein
VALLGKNRAEGIGKYDEAQVFADWLVDHLAVQRPDLGERSRTNSELPADRKWELLSLAG